MLTKVWWFGPYSANCFEPSAHGKKFVSHIFELPLCFRSSVVLQSVYESEISETKKCVCVPLHIVESAPKDSFNGTVEQLWSITFRLQTCWTNKQSASEISLGACHSECAVDECAENMRVVKHLHPPLRSWSTRPIITQSVSRGRIALSPSSLTWVDGCRWAWIIPTLPSVPILPLPIGIWLSRGSSVSLSTNILSMPFFGCLQIGALAVATVPAPLALVCFNTLCCRCEVFSCGSFCKTVALFDPLLGDTLGLKRLSIPIVFPEIAREWFHTTFPSLHFSIIRALCGTIGSLRCNQLFPFGGFPNFEHCCAWWA